MAYASACNGEVLGGERAPNVLFPQQDQIERMHAREDFVLRQTEANSRAINRPELKGDRLGTSNLAPLTSDGQINPALAANHIQVIKDTHGKTSHLSAADIDALSMYLKSLERASQN
jgi:hypothetical protein